MQFKDNEVSAKTSFIAVFIKKISFGLHGNKKLILKHYILITMLLLYGVKKNYYRHKTRCRFKSK